MGGLNVSFKSTPQGALDLSALSHLLFSNLESSVLMRMPFASGQLGDYVTITETGTADVIVLSGTTRTCLGVGAGLRAGRLIVEGDVGAMAGRKMSGGHLDIRGSAGDFLASGMTGGLLTVAGRAGDYAGGQPSGEKFGMAGGTVHIAGDLGERAGERMRRGLIVVNGRTGVATGSRMAGGTIWALGGLGAGAGPMMRRGTLIAPSAQHILPTFADCGRHDLNFLGILSRHVRAVLGPLAPGPLPEMVQRFAGDFATIGKGEILLTA
jgi:formylmethanofuran dehydrogenase subunit C